MSEEFFSLTPVAGVPELQPVYVCPPPTPCTSRQPVLTYFGKC
jgi:hypothetical protein